MSREQASHADGPASALIQGSAEAFEELFVRYSDRLTAYCHRIGGREESEDLAQEALLRAWANLGRFDTARHMWPWLKAIASNLVIDRARKGGRETPLESGHDRASIDDGELRIEEGALLSEAMAELTPSQRTALRLRYLEDWGTAEVASFLGLSVPALKQLSYRARDRLRAEYRRLTEGPLAWILFPARVIRRWVQVPASKAQRTAGRVGSHMGLAGDGAYQLAVGVLGLALVVGGWASTPSSGRPASVVTTTSTGGGSALSTTPPGPNDGTRPSQSELDPGAASSASAPIEEVKKPKGERKVDEATDDIVEFVTDPNQETKEPEDARIQSVAFSPGFASDRTVFAAGTADCQRRLCTSVLFRSSDGGTSWTRESATEMVAGSLLLPPAYGRGDNRLFSMGAQGLQISDDGGQSFHPALVTSGPQTAGSAAISPAFNGDDPSILIGAETLMRYRDDRRTLEPVPGTAPGGPFEPAYSHEYVSDQTIFLGGTNLDPATGRRVATVYRCVDVLCSPASLEGQQLSPRIRMSPDFATSGRVYAFTQEAIFASEDAGEVFAPLPLAWSGEWLRELVVDPQGRLVAGTLPKTPGGPGGLYLSSDGGLSWTELESGLFAHGAASLGVSGDRIVVALAEGGVACSSDAGLTWAPRCQASSPS